MSKDRDTWVAVENDFPDHPKLVAVGAAGGWAHICAICYADRFHTNGFIPDMVVWRILHQDAVMSDATDHGLLDDLVEANLWEKVDSGYQIHDYLNHQRNADEIKDLRRIRAEAGRRGGIASGEARRSKRQANANGSEPEVEVEVEGERAVSSSTSTEDLPFSNLDPGLEIEISRLLGSVTDKDDQSEKVLRVFAEKLPVGVVAKVRESSEGKHVRYAVGALKDEIRERGLRP